MAETTKTKLATGFDTCAAVTKAQFEKLKESGHTFFIARVHRSIGEPDATGIKNIQHAREAGFKDVDAYIFPYTTKEGESTPTAATQMTNTINALKTAKVQIGILWLDVEVPSSWSTDIKKNQKFIEDMADTAAKAGYPIGIYTSEHAWTTIFGSTYTSYSGYPLWWAKYNCIADLTTGWTNFGGWTAATIHQYDKDHSENGVNIDPNVK